MVTELGKQGMDLTKGIDIESNILKQQLEQAQMAAQHYAMVATRAILLLEEELVFGNPEIEELKKWVLLQRLEKDEKLHYTVVSVEAAGAMLEEEKAREESAMTDEEWEASKATVEETSDEDSDSG